MTNLEIWNNKFSDYSSLLGGHFYRGNEMNRTESFSVLFNSLLKKTNNEGFNIIETGTSRVLDTFFEGCSTKLFSEFVELFGGNLTSIDNSIEVHNEAKKYFSSSKIEFITDDSLQALRKINLDNVDLFYLDSYDVEFDNDRKSAGHHFSEFKIIEPFLKDCLLAIDDNICDENGRRYGKGRIIYQYLSEKNIFPIYDGYVLVYKF